jgi:ATP-dependent RNA helicase RhlE
VHRIGRTARAGADGIAISLCSHDERPYLRDIEKLIRMAIPASGDARPAPQHPPQPHGRNGQHRNGQNRQAQGRQKHRNGQRPRHSDRKPEHSHQPNPSQPRPIASTKPIGGDFSDVAFMQSR